METVYKELFQTRNQIHTLKNNLEALTKQCSCRFSHSCQDEIDKYYEDLANLSIRKMILERLCKSKVYSEL